MIIKISDLEHPHYESDVIPLQCIHDHFAHTAKQYVDCRHYFNDGARRADNDSSS